MLEIQNLGPSIRQLQSGFMLARREEGLIQRRVQIFASEHVDELECILAGVAVANYADLMATALLPPTSEGGPHRLVLIWAVVHEPAPGEDTSEMRDEVLTTS